MQNYTCFSINNPSKYVSLSSMEFAARFSQKSHWTYSLGNVLGLQSYFRVDMLRINLLLNDSINEQPFTYGT